MRVAMTLYRNGDSGEPVRDIQNRLSALGFDPGPDPRGEFGDSTEKAVREFQESRRLAVDGMVGRETWRAMVDAGFRLGDRMLYHRMPMLHGEDVSDLQRKLSSIGFEVGRIDGIFGSDTLAAVLEFQQNRHMAEDGIVGPEVVSELETMARETAKMGRHHVRERVWLASLPAGLAGQRVYLDAFCRDDHEAAEAWTAAGGASLTARDAGAQPLLSRSVDTRPAERLRAAHANELAADLIVGFAHPGTDVPGVHFFASAHSHSEAGMALAEMLATGLGIDPVGRSTPLLRSTRAPAVLVALPRLDSALGRAAIRILDRGLVAAAAQEPSSPR
jgi:N-acetylmuramoyl-L-alanine amidase